MARKEKYGKEKNALTLTVFIPKTFPLTELIGRIKDEFGKCAWKTQPALEHYNNISVQRMHEQRNRSTGHMRNCESISGIPKHKTEIQTPNSTTSVDVCLTVISFS